MESFFSCFSCGEKPSTVVTTDPTPGQPPAHLPRQSAPLRIFCQKGNERGVGVEDQAAPEPGVGVRGRQIPFGHDSFLHDQRHSAFFGGRRGGDDPSEDRTDAQEGPA